MKYLAWVVTVLVAVFLIVPIIVIVPMAFSSSGYLEFPPPGFSLRWFETFFSSSQWMRATGTSLQVAGSTVLLSCVLGTMAAFAIKRFRGSLRMFTTGYLSLPLMIPVVVMAIGVYLLYVNIGLNGSVAGLVLAHTVIALPYVLINVSASLANLPPSHERAARSLGAHPMRAFFSVTLPAIYPGVLAGALFAFLTSFDEVIVSVFVSDVRTTTLPVMMWESVQTDLDPTIAAIAVLLIGLTVVSLTLAQLVMRIPAKRSST